MGMRDVGRKITSPNPRVIELIAILAAVIIVLAGAAGLWFMPRNDFTLGKVLSVLSVIISALGVATLLFLWAQLRHTAVQDKLFAYHEFFQDLPKAAKVTALYSAMGKLKIERPMWQTPLTPTQRDLIVNDPAPEPDKASVSIREYLNDFEEFAAAVNVGLLDLDYTYHIESARILNAYYGFEEIIKYWLAEDQQKAVAHKAAGVVPSDYYGELRKLAEHWRSRKLKEVAEAERERDRRGVLPKL